MPHLQYRWMTPEEVTKVADIDRTEQIRTGYTLVDGQLTQKTVNWDSPPWQNSGDGSHTIAAQIKFCREHLARKGQMYGAFDGGRLVGIGLIQHDIREHMAQLAYLYVSNGYRRHGIGDSITNALFQAARGAGATTMYVSATPSESAIGFYLRCGFKPTATPLPELFALEPEDIHLVKTLET